LDAVFSRSVQFYDAIYAAMGKDYPSEARKLDALIQQHKRSPGKRLLDVACGTGCHLACLRDRYEVEGLDLNDEMLQIARARCPGVPFHCGDMMEFDLGRTFDVVTCLFSSVGYAKTLPRLRLAVRTMTRHVNAGGLVIVEPWVAPEAYRPGTMRAHFVDQPDLKIARMSVSDEAEYGVAALQFHYLVATPDGVDYFAERHDLGLFSHDEYLAAFAWCGLGVVHDESGLMSRGLYIGIHPG